MFAHECLCVIVISRIGEGGKPKYEKIRPYGGKAHLPDTDFTPLQKQQKPGGLDFSRLPGFYGQKEKPRRLYQILRGYVAPCKAIDTICRRQGDFLLFGGKEKGYPGVIHPG